MLVLQEDEYEWFKAFAEFRHLLLPHLRPGNKILILGCGNSLLPMDLWREGFRDITSVDLSPAVIQKMASRAEAEVTSVASHELPPMICGRRRLWGSAVRCCLLPTPVLQRLFFCLEFWRGRLLRSQPAAI